MKPVKSTALGEVLGYQTRLPLSWTSASAGTAALPQLMEEAQRVLATCSMLEETRRRGENDDALESEIDRLHQKTNLVLEMLGTLLSVQQARPAPHPLWLSAEGVLWLQHDPTITAGASGLLSIHLHRALPAPLVLPAEIRHSGHGEISARFTGLSEHCQSELERHVFLRHRRAIAEGRHSR